MKSLKLTIVSCTGAIVATLLMFKAKNYYILMAAGTTSLFFFARAVYFAYKEDKSSALSQMDEIGKKYNKV